MKNIFNKLGDAYKGNVIILLLYTFLVIMLIFGYRIETYQLIKKYYPDLALLDFIDYLYLAIYYDSTTILYSVIALFTLIFLTFKTRRALFISISAMSILVFIFLLVCIDFFRTYETTFQTSFLGKEHATALLKILKSITAEISSSFIKKLIITSSVIAVISYAATHKNMLTIYKTILSSGKKTTRVILFLPLTIILMLLVIKIASSSDEKYINRARSYAGVPSQNLVHVLRELSMNPLYNLMYSTKKSTPPWETLAIENEPFELTLDTSSIISKKVYNQIGLIPRGVKYNIIFYFFESTPAKYLDIKIKGKHVAPNWHRLMENSFIAENHYANYPLSANALLSVFTSAYGSTEKEPVIQKYPKIRLKSLSAILKSKGYRTSLLHTGMLKYAGQKRFLQHRGFDLINDYENLKRPPYVEWVGWGIHEEAMNEPAIAFMKENPEKPFFVTFMPVNPHHPYAIPDKKYQITGDIPYNINYREKNWLRYLNSLHYADAMLGELLDRLGNEGLLENTLVFVFADHGEAFYQHQQNYNHPLFLYEENVHIPFLIYSKQFFKESLFYKGISRHIDIMPTVLDILSISPCKEMEGISLFSKHSEQLAVLNTTWKDDIYAVRDGHWKYIYRLKDGWEELYNLHEDPDETNNLADDEIKQCRLFQDYLRKAYIHNRQFYKNMCGQTAVKTGPLTQQIQSK